MTRPAMTLPELEQGTQRPFHEPWQAKAFALVVLLHRQGYFGWDEWVRTLAAEIAASPQAVGETADQAYHRQFLAALERIVVTHGMSAPETLHARKEAWRRAYLNTPHGHAVDLAAADRDDHDHDADHDHDLVARRTPIAVSPARARTGAPAL